MVLLSELEQSVAEQQSMLNELMDGQSRERLFKTKLSRDFVTIITGIRRCGKSTLMRQLMRQFPSERIAFFNFEDPRVFGFDVHDFAKFDTLFEGKEVFFFDEIQNVENWELYVRKLHDQQKTVCITGSNASLLSKELGTRLTGRYLQVELFPFSFSEFSDLLGKEKTQETFDEFLKYGGLPAYVQTQNVQYLQQLFRDILYRDIIVRYGIRNSHTVEALALYLMSNVGKLYSLNTLKKTFEIGSANSVSDYLHYFEDSYLLFSLPKFSWSLKSVAINQKKIYTIDSGFAQANSLSFTKDKGRLLENQAFIHLKNQGKELYYFKEKGECDFVVKEGEKVTELIQVCYELTTDNLKREMNGLLEALHFFGLQKGTIVTLKQNDFFVQEGKEIQVISGDKWFSK